MRKATFSNHPSAQSAGSSSGSSLPKLGKPKSFNLVFNNGKPKLFHSIKNIASRQNIDAIIGEMVEKNYPGLSPQGANSITNSNHNSTSSSTGSLIQLTPRKKTSKATSSQLVVPLPITPKHLFS